MNEEKETATGKEGTNDNSTEGVQSKTTSIIEEARQERIALEKIRDELKSENDRFERLKSDEILSGRAELSPQDKKEEVDPIEYSKKVLAGKI